MDEELEAAYGTPESMLGNQEDPLDECVYIILSFQTDLAKLKASWAALRGRFPSWQGVRRASVARIAAVIRESGLQVQKAERVKALLSGVQEAVGTLSLDRLREMAGDEAEAFLLKLPGLSWKGARCVLLYSLGHERFPVDVNTFRVLLRTGVLPTTAVYRRKGLHDAIERAVPAPRRRALHVNLVVHGQQTCTPIHPKCCSCSLRAFCPRIGVVEGACRKRREVRST